MVFYNFFLSLNLILPSLCLYKFLKMSGPLIICLQVLQVVFMYRLQCFMRLGAEQAIGAYIKPAILAQTSN